MSARWHALFIPLEDADRVESALRESLAALGYQPYDPFPGGSGTPPGLTDLVRTFVAPPAEGWTRVLGEVDAAALPALSAALDAPLLEGWLSDGDGGFAVWGRGARRGTRRAASRPDRARADSTRPCVTPDCACWRLRLPDTLSGRAAYASARQAISWPRLMGTSWQAQLAGGGTESDAQAQARVLLAGQVDVWASASGQRVMAVAATLRLPANWRAPDFDAVREAYHLNRLRARTPRLPLMPGDQQALDAVPDALDYRPVYMGRASG